MLLNHLSRHSFFPISSPVSYCLKLPVPTPPKRDQSSSGDSSESDSDEDVGDIDYGYTDVAEEKRPCFLNENNVNNLVRDLGLTQSNAELLTSRLKQWNLLDESVSEKRVTGQRKPHQTFSSFFSRQDGLCFCNNVAGLFEGIGITRNPSEWRLFIDGSTRNLKAVLLHNRNNHLSLPMADSAPWGGLHQCQDVCECLEVRRLWMGGHLRLQNGVIPD